MIKLKAKENCYLTQVDKVDDSIRVYCTELICSNDEKDNWRDASEEEYEEWQARMEALEDLNNEELY